MSSDDGDANFETLLARVSDAKVRKRIQRVYDNNQELQLLGFGFTEDALIRNNVLTQLWMYHCSITDRGACALASALEVNKTITMVVLDDNRIGDVGVSALAHMLGCNTTLERLLLRRNAFTPSGNDVLFQAVADSATLIWAEFGNAMHVILQPVFSTNATVKLIRNDGIPFTMFNRLGETVSSNGIFDSLPDEMLVSIFKLLDALSVVLITGICKRFRRIALDRDVSDGVLSRDVDFKFRKNVAVHRRRLGLQGMHDIIRAHAKREIKNVLL
jgi:hypothetical protein